MPLRKVSAFLGEKEYEQLMKRATGSHLSVSAALMGILTGREAPIQTDEGEKQWSKHRQVKSRKSS